MFMENVPYSSKFSRSINFVIFVRCKLITEILSTNIFSPMGVSIGAAMNHENCCLCRLNHGSFRPRKFGAIRYYTLVNKFRIHMYIVCTYVHVHMQLCTRRWILYFSSTFLSQECFIIKYFKCDCHIRGISGA